MIYLIIITLSLIVVLLLIFFVFFGILTDFLGAPFVPTSSKMIREILDQSNLKKGQIFIELGSGDGRVVRFAVKNYGVSGIGIEFHPLLVWYSNFVSKITGLKNIVFKRQNFFSTDLSKANVLFLFLLPKALKKLRPKILKECKKGTLIISHGFKIEDWNKYLVKKQNRELFPTYYYKI